MEDSHEIRGVPSRRFWLRSIKVFAWYWLADKATPPNVRSRFSKVMMPQLLVPSKKVAKRSLRIGSPRDRAQGAVTMVGRLGIVPFYAIAGFLGALLLRPYPGLPQIYFSIFLFALYISIYRVLFHHKSVLDIGSFFLFAVLTYQLFPLISLEVTDYNLGVFADARLAKISLSAEFVSEIWSLQTLIMTGFGAAYLMFKRGESPSVALTTSAQNSLFQVALGVSTLVVVASNVFLSGESYLEGYVITQNLPIFVIQVLNIINQMFFASMIGFLVLTVPHNPRRAVVVALSSCFLLFFTTDSRTPIVIIALATIIVYDQYRARINPAILLGLAMFLLALFMFAGVLRGSGFLTDLLGQNEFMAVYVTTLDVSQIAITGAARDLGAELWVADLLRPIPGQLLPFEKFDAALWYITTFYPLQAEAGEAYGFSMTSEVVLSGSTFSALARAGLLGLLVALVVGWLERSRSIYAKVGAVWLFCYIYLCYRDATFTLVPRFLFQFGPALMIIFVIDRFFVLKPGVAADALAGAGGRSIDEREP